MCNRICGFIEIDTEYAMTRLNGMISYLELKGDAPDIQTAKQRGAAELRFRA